MTHQNKRRQAELKAAQTKRELSKKSKKNPKNSNNVVSDITRQWLARTNNTHPVKKRKRKSKGKGAEGKKRIGCLPENIHLLLYFWRWALINTMHLNAHSVTFRMHRILKGGGSMDQFKQLTTQPSRFRREASSPAARMAQMRSNKRYKPGD